MPWLEASLQVNGELAEAVADVFARYAPGGVVVEAGVHFVNDDDPGTPDQEVVVRAYLPVDDQLESRRQKLEEALWYLGRIQPLPPARYRMLDDENWMEAWKANYRPVPVGERLHILPAWYQPEAADGRIPLRIDPGMAFGTGTHPTTRLALLLLEKWLQPGTDFIDVGCGSGILAIAALKLGARRALGVDISAQALPSARQNAALNGLSEEQLLLGQGSVAEILAGRFPLRAAPLVAANMLAPILLKLLAAGLPALVQPGGVLLLSGILDSHTQPIEEAAEAQGMRILETRVMEDWHAYALQRPS